MEAAKPTKLQIIKKHSQKALECLNAGILEEDVGNKARAIILYRLGQRHLVKGLQISTNCRFAEQMQVEMNKTMSNITTRLAGLESTSEPGSHGVNKLYPNLQQSMVPTSSKVNNQQFFKPSGGSPNLLNSPALECDGVFSELPPTYTPKPTNRHASFSHNSGTTRSLQPKPKQASPNQDFRKLNKGEDIIFLPHGVQIFFITADGKISVPSNPGYLRIFLNCTQHSDRNNKSNSRYPLAYLQVCDWHCPLFPDTPVLLSNTGMFTFHDTTAAEPGSYVGVLLPSELPATDRALFQEYLSVFTQFRVQSADGEGAEGGSGPGTDIGQNGKTLISPLEGTGTTQDTGGTEEKILPEWSQTMSQGILAGSSWLSQGMVQGAEATGKAIQKGAAKLREHITPEETPAEVNPRVTKGLEVTKQATVGAVKVSKFLVNGLSSVVGLVGKEVAPHVKKHGSKLIPESAKKNKEASANMDGAKMVASSSIKGLSTLWSGLGTAAKTIGKSASSETVLTVKHKYGDNASQATDTAIQSAVNVGVTAFNMDNIVLKAVLKGVGKETAKAMAVEEKSMEMDKNHKEKTPKTEKPEK